MRVPISWLKEFIDIKASPEEVAEILTLGGIEVGELFDPYEELGELITAKILDVKFPEDLKNLAVCELTDGKERYTVFTTAKDQVKPGLVVGFIKPGSLTFGGDKVGVKEIKKIKSEGMILSPYEAGLSEEKEKLLVFPEETPIGVSIYEVLNIKEPVLELEVTPNRGDVLSILGAARELHVLTGWELKPLAFEKELYEGEPPEFDIEIEDKEGCFRYIGRAFYGVKNPESPFFIQKRLWMCGQRPISLLVDLTNYIMFELGQPLHAFDIKKIKDKKIIVRKAKEGEKLLFLDGVERTLSPEDTVIADPEKVLALAGIMGGEDSGVGEDTEEVLLEAAWFNSKKIRLSSQRHKISTESSYRFERKIDPEGTPLSVLRFTQLLKKLHQVEKFSLIKDVYEKPFTSPRIFLSFDKTKNYLGFEIEKSQIKEFLSRVGKVEESKTGFTVTPHSFRQDLTIDVDLIEEIARLYGYEKIPTTFPWAELKAEKPERIILLEKRVKQIFMTSGLMEVITYSFINPDYFEKLMIPEDDPRRKFLKLANPLSQHQSVMRTSLVPGLLEVARTNFSREITSLKIFEVGKVFFPKDGELPDEPLHAGFLLMGNREEKKWYVEDIPFDIYDVKGILEEFFEKLALEVKIKPYSEEPFLKRGISFDLFLEGEKIGFAGEVKRLILKSFEIETGVFVGEIFLEKILDKISLEAHLSIKKPPKYPSTSRDVTFIISESFQIGEIFDFIKSLEIPYLEEVRCIKIYKGDPIPPHEKSVSLRFWYRAEDRTLQDDEINQIQEEVAKKIFEKFKARPR